MYRLVITWIWFVCIYCFDMRFRLARHLVVRVCSWIFKYLCNQCLSPLTLWVLIPLMARCTRHTIMLISDWSGFLFSSVHKSDLHDKTEIVLKGALHTSLSTPKPRQFVCSMYTSFSYICFTYSSLLLFCSRNNLFLVICLTIQLRYSIYLFITVVFFSRLSKN